MVKAKSITNFQRYTSPVNMLFNFVSIFECISDGVNKVLVLEVLVLLINITEQLKNIINMVYSIN